MLMMQGQQGVMMVDDSEDEEDEEIEDDWLVYCVLVHYENQQFLDMEETKDQLRLICGNLRKGGLSVGLL